MTRLSRTALLPPAILAAAALVSAPALAQPQERYERKGANEWTYSYDNGRTVEKEERKGREYKHEWRRGDSERKYEEKKDGSWKEEIRDGDCKIVRERTSDGQYKVDRDC